MPISITDVTARDIRFPTSRQHIGSDAMNPDPDYSAAYIVLKTNSQFEGHGLTFTIGRGNELCVAAAHALKPLLVGKTLESFTADMGAFWRMITGDSQLRWVGPEKGVPSADPRGHERRQSGLAFLRKNNLWRKLLVLPEAGDSPELPPCGTLS